MTRMDAAKQAMEKIKGAESLMAQLEEYELAHKLKECREALESRRVIGFMRDVKESG